MDDLVKDLGAANTLLFGPSGVAAYNTDTKAAVDSLAAVLLDKENQTLNPGIGVKTALVLGAGGAARAVALGLKNAASM